MRSLFWRVFASFWLAIVLVAGLSMLLGRALNQDAWIINQHPVINGFAQQWTRAYEEHGKLAAQFELERIRDANRIGVQILDENGQLLQSSFTHRAAAYEAKHQAKRLPWRRLTTEYTSSTGESYLFIYRIPHPELEEWHRSSLLWPISALSIALVVIGLLSLLLTLNITRPLARLRGAVHDLGQNSYQQTSLAELSKRGDELGVLAQDFNRMGARVQDLISSQRQLLRDVSHELRSPLARLRIALALAERAEGPQRQMLWPRLVQECDRLEALIAEILTLARLDADATKPHPVAVGDILKALQANFALSAPEQRLNIQQASELHLTGWADTLERALDNLIRNATRFNPSNKPIEISAQRHQDSIVISVRDHGPGAPAEVLDKLGEPFFRAPGQANNGHGLGLAIAKRTAQRHQGHLVFSNHPEGGFVATLSLPAQSPVGT